MKYLLLNEYVHVFIFHMGKKKSNVGDTNLGGDPH